MRILPSDFQKRKYSWHMRICDQKCV